ncbi:hypothetical protein [Mesorhizobium loti]|uniref:hypothetical protein n=1 Tax=Rhizobium loti TaxID=381 RepID=UPI001268A172|nr:hypothetical protein [Mesorhizobium loti]
MPKVTQHRRDSAAGEKATQRVEHGIAFRSDVDDAIVPMLDRDIVLWFRGWTFDAYRVATSGLHAIPTRSKAKVLPPVYGRQVQQIENDDYQQESGHEQNAADVPRSKGRPIHFTTKYFHLDPADFGATSYSWEWLKSRQQ